MLVVRILIMTFLLIIPKYWKMWPFQQKRKKPKFYETWKSRHLAGSEFRKSHEKSFSLWPNYFKLLFHVDVRPRILKKVANKLQVFFEALFLNNSKWPPNKQMYKFQILQSAGRVPVKKRCTLSFSAVLGREESELTEHFGLPCFIPATNS